MSIDRDPRATRWLRRYAAGIVVSLGLTTVVTILGRDGHRTEALFVLAGIHVATQVYGARCLWHVTRAVLRPAPARTDR